MTCNLLKITLLLISITHVVFSTNDVQKKMEAGGIVPDAIDVAPSAKLTIIYAAGQPELELGQELTPTQVKEQPETVKWSSKPDKYYTLSMVDPDAPSREDPKFREVNHWLVVNIPNNDIKSGDTITEYLGSGPPKGTGLHRYILLVHEQPAGKISVDEPRTSKTSRANRLNFSLRKFTNKYNLGNPIAGNYFQAQWDPHVEERNKNLTN